MSNSNTHSQRICVRNTTTILSTGWDWVSLHRHQTTYVAQIKVKVAQKNPDAVPETNKHNSRAGTDHTTPCLGEGTTPPPVQGRARTERASCSSEWIIYLYTYYTVAHTTSQWQCHQQNTLHCQLLNNNDIVFPYFADMNTCSADSLRSGFGPDLLLIGFHIFVFLITWPSVSFLSSAATRGLSVFTLWCNVAYNLIGTERLTRCFFEGGGAYWGLCQLCERLSLPNTNSTT